MGKSLYDELRHELDTKMLNASALSNATMQRDFVAQTFAHIHKQYTEKHIHHAEYLKLINRLAAFKPEEYNDYIDMLAGAAAVNMLDFAIEQSKRGVADLSPEQARQRRDVVTDMTGIQPVQPEVKETLTIDDLTRVFIRAKMPDGRYRSIDCAEASDEQFDIWATSRIEIQGEPGPWSMEERAKFCDMLWQAGALTVPKKEIDEL